MKNEKNLLRFMKCCDCGNIFPEWQSGSRPAVLEDCVEPWDSIALCPVCGSYQLSDLGSCELCGDPIDDSNKDDSVFCKRCRMIIDRAFLEAVSTVYGYTDAETMEEARQALETRAAEMKFYEGIITE